MPRRRRSVIDAGARFVVGPVFRPDVIDDVSRARRRRRCPAASRRPRSSTAWDAGADIVKVFPATALGPGFFKDVRGPLPQVKLMPTGGVTRENAGDWIRAGAVAIGVGTALVDRRAVAERRFDDITANAAALRRGRRLTRGAGTGDAGASRWPRRSASAKSCCG